MFTVTGGEKGPRAWQDTQRGGLKVTSKRIQTASAKGGRGITWVDLEYLDLDAIYTASITWRSHLVSSVICATAASPVCFPKSVLSGLGIIP